MNVVSKVSAACRRIEQAEVAPNLASLASEAGLSAWHFQRVFKAATGVTPKQYAKARQAERARAALQAAGKVTEAIYDAGFGSSGRFYEQSGAIFGMTPSAFRARGAGETIRFAIGQCRLGAILVARSQKGICAISLGADPEALLRGLQDQFPAAELLGADAEFEQWVAVVIGFVEAPRAGLDLPLDIRGTAFQRRVWQALREVPPGETASYAEIAARIGAPKAVRAVASACAANMLAVAIPCHRVVRMDSGLGGYRWGLARKRELLAMESDIAG